MHGEHIKLVLASLAFSNDGLNRDHVNFVRDVGAALPSDTITQHLVNAAPDTSAPEYEKWGDVIAARLFALERRAVALAKELDATMRSWTTLDHTFNVSPLNKLGGLFGPEAA